MTDILGAILRGPPSCMYCQAPATVIDDPFALCDRCEAALVRDLKQSGFPNRTFGENASAGTGSSPVSRSVEADSFAMGTSA